MGERRRGGEREREEEGEKEKCPGRERRMPIANEALSVGVTDSVRWRLGLPGAGGPLGELEAKQAPYNIYKQQKQLKAGPTTFIRESSYRTATGTAEASLPAWQKPFKTPASVYRSR